MNLNNILTQVQWETRDSNITLTTLVPVLNALQDQWVQPKARVELAAATLSVVANTASYTLASISSSIWLIRFLTEVISGKENNLDPLLPEQDVESDGIRQWGGSLIIQPTPTAARTIKVYAWKALTAFDAANGAMVPDIQSQFHDLYVLGAAARIGRRQDEMDTPEPRDYWGEFLSRLQALEQFQDKRKQQPVRRAIRARGYF